MIKTFEWFRGLRKQADVTVEIHFIQIVFVLYDDGRFVGLPYQPYNFSVPFFSVNEYLIGVFFLFVRYFDAALKFKHHRAGSINECNIVFAGGFVG